MAAALTPGQWQIDQFGGQDKWAVGPDVAHRVCDVYGKENARLIASAPDLLAALRDLLDATFEDGDGYVRDISDCLDARLIADARAAIAKATGAAL